MRWLAGGSTGTGAFQLLNDYDEGFAFLAAEGGGFGQVAVKDNTTTANNRNNDPAYELITQSGTSPKLTVQADGTLAWSPHNLLPESDDYTSSWTTDSAVVSSDATTGPNGVGADRLTDDNSSGTGTVSVSLTSFTLPGPGGRYTYAVELKADQEDFGYLRPTGYASGNGPTYFDLANGVVGTTDAEHTASIFALDDGWYLCQISFDVDSADLVGRLRVGVAETDGSLTVDRDGTSSIFAGRARLSRGDTSFNIQTSGSAVYYPAFEWNDSRWRLLVEPAATNLALHASDFTNAAWVKTGGGGISAAMTATGPDGVANSASTLTADGANGTALQAITSASSSRLTSMWVKRRTGSGDIDMTQDNGGTWTTVTVTSSWTRVSIAAVTSANPTVGIRIVTSGDEVDVALFDHETGTVATSPVPTFGATVTRGEDQLSVDLSAIPYADEAGVLYVKAESQAAIPGYQQLVQIDDGTNDNRVSFAIANGNERVRADIESGNTQTVSGRAA
jgi:hypothetical protein